MPRMSFHFIQRHDVHKIVTGSTADLLPTRCCYCAVCRSLSLSRFLVRLADDSATILAAPLALREARLGHGHNCLLS